MSSPFRIVVTLVDAYLAVGLRDGLELRGLIEAWRADVRRVSPNEPVK